MHHITVVTHVYAQPITHADLARHIIASHYYTILLLYSWVINEISLPVFLQPVPPLTFAPFKLFV
jgi:hypothetical protein